MKNQANRQFGFAIIEALVALVIMGFGILALAGMQGALTRNVDYSQQRSEAVRLAQEKMEELRSFTGIASTTIAATASAPSAVNTSAPHWDALSSSADSVTTNAVYSRSWVFGGVVADSMRPLTVTVTWTDRAGEAQTVTLTSVLSKTNPADSGFLGFPLPQNTNLKRPLDRNLSIPIPSIDIGGGISAMKFGTSGQYVEFSNVSGDVVKICTPTLVSNPTNAQVIAALNSDAANCTTITGYIVTGYVMKDSSVSTSAWSAISSGLGMSYAGLTRNAAGPTGIVCEFGDAVDQNTQATIANTKSYLCVIPLTAPSPAPESNGPYNWSGKMLIAGNSLWHSSGNSYYVCRYQYAATNFLTNVNQRNVQPYVNVNTSLDQQNYLIATSNAGGTPVCPTSMTLANVSSGVLHQDCRSSSNGAFATDCPLFGATTYYALLYSGNGHSGGAAPTDASSPYAADSSATTLAAGTLTKTGYSFAGWNTAANGLGTSYAAGASITISGITTLYAQWTPSVRYTMTYNGNSNTGGTAPADATQYAYGASATVLGAGTLTRTGYYFAGWRNAASGTDYLAGASLAMTANTTLDAQWSATVVNKTVSYDGNGSTSGTAPTAASYATGTVVTVQGAGSLAKTDSTFVNWNTAVNGTGTSYAAGASFTLAADTPLYAQWRLNAITLATPTPSWSGGVLSWAGVPNATSGYYQGACSSSNCTPVVAVTATTSTSISPSLTGNSTKCYNVRAKGVAPYVDSATSATYCVTRSGNSYTYTP
jgi:type IV pilus modification protein PilV